MSDETAVRRLVGALDSMLADLPQKMGKPADWVYYDMPIGVKLDLNEFLQLKFTLASSDFGLCVAYHVVQNTETGRQYARGQFIASPVGMAMIEAALAGPGALQ